MSSRFLASQATSTSVRVYGLWPDGSKRWESYESLTAVQAGVQARNAGAHVLRIEAGISPRPEAAAVNGLSTVSVSRRFDLLLFSQELLSLLSAGLNLVEAIETLSAKAQAGEVGVILHRLVGALHQGQRFSQVLELQPAIFPPVYVASVRASERTGNLPQALERYIAYQQQFDALRRKVVTASIYPLMLLVVGSLVMLFLLGFVVPRFAAVYESSGGDLPWLSFVMLTVGRFIHGHVLEVAAGACAFVVVLAALARWTSIGLAATSLVLRMPGIKERVRTFRLARFFRGLSLLLSSGVPLLRALIMVNGLLGAERAKVGTRVHLHVERGLALSTALELEGLTTPVAQSLLKVGERSGQLPIMLEKAGAFHDEELARWLDGVSRLLEPVLMLAIGLVIGTVVVLMYLPIFDLASSFQ